MSGNGIHNPAIMSQENHCSVDNECTACCSNWEQHWVCQKLFIINKNIKTFDITKKEIEEHITESSLSKHNHNCILDIFPFISLN